MVTIELNLRGRLAANVGWRHASSASDAASVALANPARIWREGRNFRQLQWEDQGCPLLPLTDHRRQIEYGTRINIRLLALLVACQESLDQLLHRGSVIVGIERVLFEFIGGVSGKSEILVRIAAVGDILQCFLDTETARVRQPAGGVIVMVFPCRESAM